MRKNLQHITLKNKTVSKKQTANTTFLTDEGIEIKSEYSKNDVQNLEHLNFVAGIAPNLRGSQVTMYVKKPWKTREHLEFSSTKENKLGGVVIKLNNTKININSVEDLAFVFNKTSINNTNISIPLDRNILPIMAFLIIAAEEHGIEPEYLSGSIQNNILEDIMVGNSHYKPIISYMKIISDFLKYTSTHMPKFNNISFSGYHLQEAGATNDLELAFTFANSLEYIKKGLENGLDIDTLASKITFVWSIGMNHFMEIAKMRAARMLWSKLVKQFNPINEESLLLRTHCKTSNWNLTDQTPYNNISRATIEATAAVFGGTQNLYTNTLNEAIKTPTGFPIDISKKAQLYLQEETKITKTVDPWAGSYYVEKLTDDIVKKTWTLIEEIEELGGMTKAIEAGIPKIKIKEAITKKQTRIASCKNNIIEVNKFKLNAEVPITIQKTDRQKVRNSEKVTQALSRLTKAVNTGKENLLTLTIDAARKRATLSEISNALETK